jgi:hypothetical protein
LSLGFFGDRLGQNQAGFGAFLAGVHFDQDAVADHDQAAMGIVRNGHDVLNERP